VKRKKKKEKEKGAAGREEELKREGQRFQAF